MKIFNWVHKRFHPNTLMASVQNVVKSETEKSNTVKDTLDEVALVERHDNIWEDGILTIGTFGFHPLKPFNQQIEYLVLESEEDNNNEEMNSQGNSLHGTDDEYESGNNNIDDEEANPLISNYLPLTQILMASAADTDIAQETTVKIDGKKKTQRTTLADLFLADSDFQMKLDSGKTMSDYSKKVKFERKNNLSFVKKLIPRLKNDSSPKKNMQTLMRRMLKRKIHPELDTKINKSDRNNMSATAIIITSDDLETASESVSLLTIPGVFLSQQTIT